MPEINLPTAAKQELIKSVVDAIKAETTLFNKKVNELTPVPKVLKSKV